MPKVTSGTFFKRMCRNYEIAFGLPMRAEQENIVYNVLHGIPVTKTALAEYNKDIVKAQKERLQQQIKEAQDKLKELSDA